MSYWDLNYWEFSAELDIIWSLEDTHADGDVRELSVKPLLCIIEEIFQPATPSVPRFGQGTKVQLNVLDDSALQFDLSVMLDLLSSTIDEISSKISSGGDEHETTMGILKNLRSYNWDAKVALALVAFAFNFGDFLVMAQPYSSNPLLKSVPLLKELPDTQERVDTFEAKFVELSNLIKATLNMTKCIVEFIEFESHNKIKLYYRTKRDILSAVYWTIKCIVGCTSQILGLTGMGRGKISSIEETKSAQRVRSKHIYLKKELNELKEEKRSREASQTLERLMKKFHNDNTEVMRGLIYAKEDQRPLLKGDTQTRAGIEVLRSKHVLLLISDMKNTDEELFILKKMYKESQNDPPRAESQYEMVWIPVVDRSTPWTHAKQDQFENCQLRMPWYSVYHPLMIDIGVIKYIQEEWQFEKNPIIVVFDPQGKLINNNALHIIWIWGGHAFPFTSSIEAELWAAHKTWNFEFLAGSIYADVPISREEDNYVCLYGGGNIYWIKKFTTTAQKVAEAARIKLQILYVGKSDPEEQIRENISIITVEKLSYSLQDLTLVRFFWERLKSMQQSKMHLRGTEESDPVMQEINTILSFDNSDEGWAVFCRGSDMAIAQSEEILRFLNDFDLWRTYMNEKEFVTALKHYHHKLLLVQRMVSPHKDNMEVLRALIHAKEDQKSLFKGDARETASIEVLKSKTVLLLISNEEFADEELLFMLKKMYREYRKDPEREKSQYEVVWIPILDRLNEWNKERQQRFKNHQLNMPWYSVYHPLLIDPMIIVYIPEVWHVNKKSILAVLDPQGKLVNNNALHMFWIWGSLAFPFTSEKEAELWKQQTSGIKLLADSINEDIPNWVAEDNYICLYGGGNIDWIKKFTAKAQAITEAAHIKLQILYVGKSNPEEQIQGNISTVIAKKLSHSLQDHPLVRFFWERLKIICHSRMKLGRTEENDPIMQEINTILGFDEKDEGWAVFCRGSDMAIAKSENILQCLNDFDLWRTYMNEKEFVTTLKHYHRKLLLVQLMESQLKDNMEVLRALIQAEEDQRSLFKGGDARETASIEVLKNKTVLFLISNVEFDDEELLFMLKKMYRESRQFELVWIPIVDRATIRTVAEENQFLIYQCTMPWYSPYKLSQIDLAVIMYIEQVWNFKKEPILVVLDPQGKLINNNALHMLWIWGSLAFPFTSTREAELWKQQTWGIKLLADSINEAIPSWIAEENNVCLYGGGNIDWIKKFIAKAQDVAEATHIKLQILYVGKSNPEEQIQENISTITVEKHSHSLQDLPLVRFFWERLKIICHFRMKLGFTLENDPIMQEINTILTFDNSDEGWAVFCRGSDMAITQSEEILRFLNDFDLWRTYMNEKEFVTSLKHYHHKLLLVQRMVSPHKDNMEVLRALIHAKEDQKSLFKCDARETAGIEVLKSKTVLLLISNEEFADEELIFMLKKMYREYRQDPEREKSQYEVVWIPVVDRLNEWNKERQQRFENHQSNMQWYSVYHPSLIDPAIIIYIPEVRHVKKKPIIAVLDPQGKLVNNDALHVLWIWGSLAFPFTSTREAELWKQHTWGIELLAASINEAIPSWIAEENNICLYGGGNIDWIKKFIAKAQEVAEAAHIKLQILYVGKSNPEEQIQRNISVITVEKLSHSLQDLPLVRFFWERLKIICHSRMKLGFTLENDPIMQEINTILSFDNSDEGWAVFCRGSDMAIAKSENILQCLSDFDLWRTKINGKEFVTSLKHYHRMLLHVQLMESPHKDNMEVLRVLIHAKENQPPLFKGDAKEKASIDVLKSKIVLLLISTEEFSNQELFMLKKMYTQSHQDPVSVESQYDVVWIPVVDKSTEWNEARQQLFKNHQLNMPWYSVYHPFLINPAVFIYIQEVRHLNKKPILVVLDPQGKLVSNNAFHMLWIWGMQGFPFTRAREAELWKQQTWGIKLLADSINEDISNWIKEENYICLYGGENIDWIREFIATARKVAEATSIPLQILYVGKSNSNEEQVRKIVDTITVEKLSHSLQEYHQVWFFWQRLESMWHSKTQLGCTVENDPLLLEINTLLSFDKNHEGWAVFCRGTTMAVAKSETILQSLKDFDSWKTHVEDKDFVTALNHHLNQL